jgi:hypothetical protein
LFISQRNKFLKMNHIKNELFLFLLFFVQKNVYFKNLLLKKGFYEFRTFIKNKKLFLEIPYKTFYKETETNIKLKIYLFDTK